MALDPEARVVVTARNTTDAAFRAADKNLRQFQRSLSGIRQIAGGLGLVFSARAFAGWISGAVRAADATGAHAETIKATKDAMTAMKAASDSLALNIANQLTPAMHGLTAVFTGWNRLISGADPFDFEAQINATARALHGMEVQLAASQGMPKEWRDNFSREIDAVRAKLAELKLAQEKALGLGAGGIFGADFRNSVGIRNAVAGLERIGDVYDKFAGLKRPEIKLDELMPLDGLEEIVVDAREMTVDELLKPFPSAEVARMFEPLRQEGMEAAAFLGMSFRDAFTDWILGVERDFGELLRRMAVQMAVSGIFEAFGAMFSGGTSGFAKFMSSFFGGARADGGPVSAGRSYLVGERGPEIFTPSGSGMISPGGGLSVHMGDTNIDARGADSSLIQRLPKILDDHRQRTKAEIADLIRRNRFATS